MLSKTYLAAVTALIMACNGPLASAETLTWDSNLQSAFPQDGNGNWGLSGNNWYKSLQGNVAWNNAAIDTARFGVSLLNTGSYEVVLVDDIVAGGLIFDRKYSLTGTSTRKLTLGGATPTIAVNVDDALISVDMVGTAKVIKNGSGNLTLTGNNNFQQGLEIAAGTLTFGNNAANGGQLFLTGGTLRWDAGNTRDISSQLKLSNGKQAVLDTNGNNVTFATGITGGTTGGITKTGSGTLTLGASNSFSGNLNLEGGSVVLGQAGSAGYSNTINFNGGRLVHGAGNTTDYSSRFSSTSLLSTTEFRIDTNGNNVTYASALNSPLAAEEIFKYGEGELRLTAPGTYAKVNVEEGTLTLAGNGAITGAVILIHQGAEFQIAREFTGLNQVVQGAGTLNFNAGQGKTTLWSAGTGSFTGTVKLSSGTVTLGATGTASDPGSFAFNGGILRYGLSGLDDNSSKFSVTAGNDYAIANDVGLQLNSAITGTSNNGLIKSGSGTLTLTGGATLDADIRIDDGTLSLNGGVYSAAQVTAAGKTLEVTGTGTTRIDSALNGSVNLEKAQSGTLILSRASNTTGTTLIKAGTVRLDNGATLGTGYLTVNAGATLQLNGTGTSTLANAIANSGSVTHSGTGTTTLSGSLSAFAGTTSITAGTLLIRGALEYNNVTTVAAGGAFGGTGNAAAVIVRSGGALTPGNSGSNDIGTFSARNVTLESGAKLLLNLGVDGTSDRIAIAGALVKSGTVTLDFLGTGSGTVFAPTTYTLITGLSGASLTTAGYNVTNLADGYSGTLAIDGSNLVMTVIPEPSTYALGAGVGSLLLAGLRRRRRTNLSK